jgi:hypothetical protein
MPSINATSPAESRFPLPKGTALDRVIAQFARSHVTHISPIVGCYQCLHNEPRVTSRALLAAA